jgi:hypothetical protein
MRRARASPLALVASRTRVAVVRVGVAEVEHAGADLDDARGRPDDGVVMDAAEDRGEVGARHGVVANVDRSIRAS